jgi:prepilin-type N-terminal cleavage/methylation domain-containing protein
MVHLVAHGRRLLRRVRSERGFTLVELLVVVTILSFVMTGVISMYLSGVRTQANLTASFRAQTSLHVGMDRITKDVHMACSQTAQSATSVTLSLPPCDGTNMITWCTQGAGTSYGLYRISGSACTGGVKLAESLTGGSIFSYLAQNVTAGSNALPRLHIDMTINANPATSATGYRVIDDLVFANGVRA